jgi:hypothetical protein
MTMATADGGYGKIEFDRVFSYRVGGIPVVVGRIVPAERLGPTIYAAALAGRDLRRESCGYGTTEAGAVADLFRLMR